MPDPCLIGPVLFSPWIFVQKHTRLYALVPTYSLFATDGGSGRDAGGFGTTRMDAADYGFLAYGYTFGRDGGCGSSAPVFVFASDDLCLCSGKTYRSLPGRGVGRDDASGYG